MLQVVAELIVELGKLGINHVEVFNADSILLIGYASNGCGELRLTIMRNEPKQHYAIIDWSEQINVLGPLDADSVKLIAEVFIKTGNVL